MDFHTKISRYCIRHPEKFFIIFGPGTKTPENTLDTVVINDQPSLCFSLHRECIQSTIVNTYSIVGSREFRIAMFSNGQVAVTNASQGAPWFERKESEGGLLPNNTKLLFGLSIKDISIDLLLGRQKEEN